jgi:Cyclin, N-terminal domain
LIAILFTVGHCFGLVCEDCFDTMEGKTSVFASLLEREEIACQQSELKLLQTGRVQETGAPNSIWREKVVQWCYDVADHLDEDRSIVYVAMDILDRFCSAVGSTQPMDEMMYEIASLASIFLAVRIAGSRELLLDELVSMSRGGISMRDIVAMGNSIVATLSWDHSILTPIDFVQGLFQLHPPLSKSPRRQLILDTASYLLELAVCDSFLSQCKASKLAVVALLCSLEANVNCADVASFKSVVTKVASMSLDSEETMLLRSRLQIIYSRSVENFSPVGPHVIEDDSEDAQSVPGDGDYHYYSSKRNCHVLVDEDSATMLKRSKINHHL